MAKECRTIVLRTAGTNCDAETVYALEKVGADVELVHINELLHKKKNLKEYVFLVIPGGFSYGDDIASGRVFANQLVYRLGEDIGSFVQAGKLILGICNGFQVLVKCGLLPGNNSRRFTQEVSLSYNDSDRFEDRWVYLKHSPSNCVFTPELPDVIFLPVAHAEGKFIYGDESVGKKLKRNNQIVFRYVDEHGSSAGYPVNPNGSMDSIAALCNPQGTVMGMMPHPERYITRFQHPRWTREKLKEEGIGLQIFRNAVNYIKQNL